MDRSDPLAPRPACPQKARGAIGNPTGRFEREVRVPVSDGWDEGGAPSEGPRLATTLTPDASRTIIARNDSPDVGFEQSINPYRGCEHGCVYCYARPTHGYLGLSAGLDFETRLFFKPDAARLLEAELRRPGYRVRTIALGTNTDPFQPVERRLRITRQVLEVLAAFNHPVGIVTKSALVTRDIDILAPMAAKGLARVMLSVTTLEAALAHKLEPRAALPAKRLEAVRVLAEAGVPAGVMVAPVIPALTDWEIERILEAARGAGADRAGYTLLRLPHEVKDLFTDWLSAHAPLKARHVLSLVRQCRNGLLYDSGFGTRMTGEGPYARLIATRFEAACRRLGLNRPPGAGGAHREQDTSLFRPPPQAGDQLALFAHD
ncbi:MAG: PA0069 family radical SAM protein [Proteobacteria bacterium]|nr:PA0069 family radical SAM protein [Pseudomonadota bacterium]